MVILVDEKDVPVGTMEKMEAHRKALLHRAFSIFIFNTDKELLLQQRAHHKYHSPGLWTNTCCSHPFPGEDALVAANRRLREEMGMNARLEYLFKFQYKAPFDNKLTEHEIDYVFVGMADHLPKINPEEVAAYQYKSIDNIKEDLMTEPERYTAWFRIIFEKFLGKLPVK